MAPIGTDTEKASTADHSRNDLELMTDLPLKWRAIRAVPCRKLAASIARRAASLRGDSAYVFFFLNHCATQRLRQEPSSPLRWRNPVTGADARIAQ
jgi:hypothetical protein